MQGKIIVMLAAMILVAGFAAAQTLAPQPAAPVVDGVMAKGEYVLTESPKGFWLGVALSADKSTLTIGLAAASTGWISVGLGSLRMNGAYIVIGYDSKGSQVISENKGSGHGHSLSGLHKVTKSAVKTANGQTTLEFSIPAAEWIKDGKLQLILGAANTADFVSFHPRFGSVEIAVAK